MAPRIRKSDPTYLDKLGTQEGLAVARELYRTNKKAIDGGCQLTVAEYQYLLKWATDRLTKNGQLPPIKTLTTERYQAFEHAFYKTIRREGLL
jgi:hypothetical protein